jgi:Spy/CpxP family protein refolding chaperone
MQEQNDKRKALQQNMQTQRAQLQAETRARMSEVLSPEQLKKMDSMREERQEKRHEKMEKWKEKREKHKDRY